MAKKKSKPKSSTTKPAAATAATPTTTAAASARHSASTAGKQAPKVSPHGQRRVERKRKQRNRRRRDLALVTVLAVLVIGGIGYWVGSAWYRENRIVASLEAGSCAFDTKSDPGATGEHNPNATFAVNPPSGGVHYPSPSPAGDYSTGTPPPDGQIVHSNEHGYVTLWYQPSSNALPALQEILKRHPKDVLVVPRQTLPVPVAATAWQKRLLCSEVDPKALEKFTDFYIGKGPEKVPRG